MKILAIVLAVALFVLGLLYGLGIVNVLTSAGHGHHIKHLILLWVLAVLALIWARFQSAPSR
ncbi:MAG: hypothetical protein ACYDG0_00705 [Vulcanimicrobiaceae bacterium]